MATEVGIRRSESSQSNAQREHAKADLSPDQAHALDQLYLTTITYHKCRNVGYDAKASDSNMSHWTTYTYDKYGRVGSIRVPCVRVVAPDTNNCSVRWGMWPMPPLLCHLQSAWLQQGGSASTWCQYMYRAVSSRLLDAEGRIERGPRLPGNDRIGLTLSQ